jgi:Ca-activated chloride channel family protein
MTFIYPHAFWLFVVVLPMIFLYKTKAGLQDIFSQKMQKSMVVGTNKQKQNILWHIASVLFLIVAISSPIIPKKPIVVPQESSSLIVAFDISASMKTADIYPNRLEFSKLKFGELVDNLKDERVSMFAFSSKTFLISALTGDFDSLKYLVKNISQKFVSIEGSSIYELLKAQKILKNKKTALLVFTDGTDNTSFDKELKLARQNNIKVFVYAVATTTGGTIPLSNGQAQKDQNGNLVISRLNENIKDLCLNSGGAYLQYSYEKNDIKQLLNNIRKKLKFKKSKDKTIKQDILLYQVPLSLALVMFLIPFVGRFR